MDATEFLDRDIQLVKREQAFYLVCAPVQLAIGLIAAIAGAAIADSDSPQVDALVKACGVFVGALATFPVKSAIGCSKSLNALNWLKTAHHEHCLGPKEDKEQCQKVIGQITDRILKN